MNTDHVNRLRRRRERVRRRKRKKGDRCLWREKGSVFPNEKKK